MSIKRHTHEHDSDHRQQEVDGYAASTPVISNSGQAAYVQRKRAERAGREDADQVCEAAQQGIAGASSGLPYRDQIQASFGKHDVSGIQAHVGGDAKTAANSMSAEAYATGSHVAFAQQPDLHTAAHEAAHVVQQAGGVQLSGGVGQANDVYEQHANRVADKVVAGESAEVTLDEFAPARANRLAGSPVVQRFEAKEHEAMGDLGTSKTVDGKEEKQQVELAPGYFLTFGEVVALAGDQFASIDQMRRFAENTGGGAESREEIEYALEWKLGKKGRKYSEEARLAQRKRYFSLAGNNRSHFANPTEEDQKKSTAEKAEDLRLDIEGLHPNNAVAGYRKYHVLALGEAALAVAEGQPLERAYASEAFACHYLSDAFAGGHVRTPRADISEYWNAKVPMFFYNVKGYMAQQVARELRRRNVDACPDPTGGMLDGDNYDFDPIVPADLDPKKPPPTTGCSKFPEADVWAGTLEKIDEMFEKMAPIHFGDLVSLALHDDDNLGIVADVGGGSADLKGDGHIKEGGDQTALASQAIKLSMIDLHVHATLGNSMPPLEVVEAAKGDDGLYAAERMIPEVTKDTDAERPTPDWRAEDVEALLNQEKFERTLRTFVEVKKGELIDAAQEMGDEIIGAMETGLINPLEDDVVGEIRRIVNWTPNTGAGIVSGSDMSNAVKYHEAAKETEGGLESLTPQQRTNLLIDLVSGGGVRITPAPAADAIWDIVRTAEDGDLEWAIERVGWRELRDSLAEEHRTAFVARFPEQQHAK